MAAASVIDVEPPAQRSGGSDTDTDTGADSPFNSMDADFSDAAVSAAASLDDTELWRRVSELAEEQGSHDAEGSHADDGGGKMFGMSASLRGMLLLNLVTGSSAGFVLRQGPSSSAISNAPSPMPLSWVFG